ncbi:DUF3073 domain-containing protein [Haloglycomyces albus]|uniref:DUF3073 domain-containing protein n=1 Tax=Haloglycomyces albus TaxID=526067 RepID=UPI00046D568A|nr:DUF3073 domain-containing protein [Haloglycomyces albus]
MGRGRAKAKQTKVARKLKYHSPNTDLRALERELSGRGKQDDEQREEDPYAIYAERYNVEEDDDLREEEWLPPGRKSLSSPD